MHRTNRRRLLQYLAGMGAASAAGSHLQETARAAPPSVTGMRISRYEIYPTRVPWDERVRE